MAEDEPLALGRTRRQSAQHVLAAQFAATATIMTPPATPGRRQSKLAKKKVRFSDPGPSGTAADDDAEVDESMDILSTSTGLTPMIRRTALRSKTTPKPCRTPRRRASTPFSRHVTSGSNASQATPTSPLSGEMTFLPLRQVLEGRVVRRLRRNGLSEEMNSIHSAKRNSIRKTATLVEALRRELEEKDAEIERLMAQTVEIDTERVWNLEQEVKRLRNILGEQGTESRGDAGDRYVDHEWTLAARDPFADESMVLDSPVEQFGEESVAHLVCGTPSRPANVSDSFHSIPTPPDTSPAVLPVTPQSEVPPNRRLFTSGADASVQIALPDPDRQRVEEELESLRIEVTKLTATLEGYEETAARLEETMDCACPMNQDDVPADMLPVEAQVSHLLQTLSDRTAALQSLGTSLAQLGFPGIDASEIISSLTSSLRGARLELEYVTPGEIVLPLTSSGAATLDLLLCTLRSLASQAKEADAQVDEYHALELNLRQQLGTRVEVNGELVREVERLKSCVTEREGRVTDLQLGSKRLKGALRTYARDMKELETLVVRMERELGAKAEHVAGEEAKVRGLTIQSEKAAKELASKQDSIRDLESRFAAAVSATDDMKTRIAELEQKHAQQLATLKTKHKSGTSDLNKSSGRALALRDARVAELRGEIDRVNASLRAAHESVLKLRVENGRLEGEVVEERRRAKEAVDAVKFELERVVKMSEGLFPGTPVRKGGAKNRDSGIGDEDGLEDDIDIVGDGSAVKKGKKRRRYDSGLGFLDEGIVDAI